MKRYLGCAVACACAAALAGGGCGMREAAETDAGGAAAVVNGAPIPRAEVDRITDAFTKQMGAGVSDEQRASIKTALGRQALENLVNQRLLVQEAERKGVVADPKAVEEQMEKVVKMFPDPEKMKEQLSAMGVGEAELRRDIAQNLVIKELLDRQLPKGTEPTAEEIKEFYEANVSSFDLPERVRASHILLAVSADDPPEKKAERKAALAALREKIAGGADFAEVAKANSDCPSKESGGDLGFFEKGKMVPEFETAAFAQLKGELGEVVETPFGYHLIKVTDRKEPEKASLENASARISEFLTQQRKGNAAREYLEKLRTEAKIEYPAEEFRPAPQAFSPAQSGDPQGAAAPEAEAGGAPAAPEEPAAPEAKAGGAPAAPEEPAAPEAKAGGAPAAPDEPAAPEAKAGGAPAAPEADAGR